MHIYIHIYIFCIDLIICRLSFYFDKKLKSKIALQYYMELLIYYYIYIFY